MSCDVLFARLPKHMMAALEKDRAAREKKLGIKLTRSQQVREILREHLRLPVEPK